MRLTLLTVDDASAMADLHARAFEKPWDAAAFRALLDGPGVFAPAAVRDGTLDGLILMRAVADEAEVLTLAVASDQRRRGLGGGLLASALGLAEAAGAATVFLEVADDNIPAVSLYRAAGFEPVGRRSAYYARPGARPADALLLRKTLTPPRP